MRHMNIWPRAALISALSIGVAAACSVLPAKAAVSDVLLEPISTTGANPFSPAVGTDLANVTPPPQSGGTFPGDTVGLFGGTAKQSSCDPGKLIAFLQQNPDKGAAWAAVLGITQAEIPAFVQGLTPAILRSDTQVTNHGFENGRATTIPAVLQAGTAVMVDKHGFPVIKCFCGNPLTPPARFTSVRFVGVSWPTFVSTSITIITSVNVVVNNFTLVEPSTGDSFQRPSGTGGLVDGPVTQAPPGATAPPFNAPPPSGAAPPPPAASSTAPPSSAAPTSPAAPSTTAPRSTAPSTAVPSSAAPSTAAPSSAAPGSAAPGSADKASSVVGDCFVANATAHAVVQVRNDGTTTPHTYTVTVQLGPLAGFTDTQTVSVTAAPGQTGQATITAAAPGVDDAKLPCAIQSIRDENGQVVTGGTLPPPPDTRPTSTPSSSARTPAAPATPSPRTTSPQTTGVPTTQAPRTTTPRTSVSPSMVPGTPFPGQS